MSSLLLSRRNVDFLLYEWLQVESLTTRERFAAHSRETFDAALDVYEGLASEKFAPHNKKNDQLEPRLDGDQVHVNPEVGEAVRAFSEAGLMAATQDYGVGGMQLPYVVERVGMAYMFAANPASAGYPFLTMANANLLLAHGTQSQAERYAYPMLKGRFFGTMCLSEPQAGSSLADIKTRAEALPDGSFRISGNKMWISGGDQDLSENIIHLVLAKVQNELGELPAGIHGISLFIVPKYVLKDDGEPGERNDVSVAGLNHKMGYRGTSNCALNFGEGRFKPAGRSGAIGFLLGEQVQGLAYMFHMMNEARIGVGFVAVSLGSTGYLHAVDYARQRLQGRAVGQREAHPRQVPIIEHADVRRMLLTQKAYVEGGLALTMYCAYLVDEQRFAQHKDGREQASLPLDLLTPVAKSWPSQWCLAANDLAIQVHGGYGYTRDYNVEQFYRDNRLNSIHEGTHGIQAIDLLGRKVQSHSGVALELLGKLIDETVGRAKSEATLSEFAHSLTKAWNRIQVVTAALAGVDDMRLRLANASAYLDAFGHVVVAWLWLSQALIAQRAVPSSATKDRSFYEGKTQACRFFFRWELPRISAWCDLLDPVDTTCLDMAEAWF